MKYINFFGTRVSVTNIGKQIEYIERLINSSKKGFVTYSNVHVIVECANNKELQNAVNSAALTSPDGMPLVVMGKLFGAKNMQRCSGPDMMLKIIESGLDKNYRHFFYGNTNEILEKVKHSLETKYPGINIVGSYSPPFRKLSNEENMDVVRLINNTHPDCIWVSLGAPKQELWMAENEKNIEGIMFGVGAAFNFICCDIQRAPLWMRNHGLEWFYRLMCEPKRLWKRYLITNTKFLYYLITKKVKAE